MAASLQSSVQVRHVGRSPPDPAHARPSSSSSSRKWNLSPHLPPPRADPPRHGGRAQGARRPRAGRPRPHPGRLRHAGHPGLLQGEAGAPQDHGGEERAAHPRPRPGEGAPGLREFCLADSCRASSTGAPGAVTPRLSPGLSPSPPGAAPAVQAGEGGAALGAGEERAHTVGHRELRPAVPGREVWPRLRRRRQVGEGWLGGLRSQASRGRRSAFESLSRPPQAGKKRRARGGRRSHHRSAPPRPAPQEHHLHALLPGHRPAGGRPGAGLSDPGRLRRPHRPASRRRRGLRGRGRGGLGRRHPAGLPAGRQVGCRAAAGGERSSCACAGASSSPPNDFWRGRPQRDTWPRGGLHFI